MGDVMDLLFRFGVSVVFLAIPVVLAARQKYRGSMAVCFLFAVVAFLAMEAGVVAFYLATIPLLLILKNNQARPKVAAAVMSGWAIAGLVGSAVSDVRHFRELHSKYPLESLADRLSYEKSRATDEPETVSLLTSELETPTTADQIPDNEARYRASRARHRRHALEELHSQTFAEFVAANGFGATRMRAFQRHQLRVDPLPPGEPLPKRPEVIDPPTAIQNVELAEKIQSTPPLPNQAEAVKQFTAMVDWAYIPSRQQAAGFVSHAMTITPRIQGGSADDWQTSRLELVSLLKFDAPRVYLSEHLPRMEELRNAETRPVDEFEQRALQQLRSGEDIVVDQQLNTIRMVGAVRAAKQCLDCHSARRGALLGAFSYLLDRKRPIPPPKVEERPVSMLLR